MTERPVLTRASLVGSAVQILTDGGYREIRDTKVTFWDSADTRLFEDEHGIVALVIYETWRDLADGWQYAQDNLVDLISSHMAVGEPKAREIQKLRNQLTNEMLAKSFAQVKLRPGGRVALDWARLLTEV